MKSAAAAIDDALRQAIENTDAEALEIGCYSYGDALPERKNNNPENMIENSNAATKQLAYSQMPAAYRRFYTFEDWDSRKTVPPKGYPARAEREYQEAMENRRIWTADDILSLIDCIRQILSIPLALGVKHTLVLAA